jgi:hypothetical protein
MTTNQEKRHASFRAISGTSGTINGDMFAAFVAEGVTETQFNGALIAWLQAEIPSSNTNLNGLKAEYAAIYGASSWDELGYLVSRKSQGLWFDASDTSTITEVGAGFVTNWGDKSPALNDATASGSARPTTGTVTRNGKNVLDFDGAGNFFTTSNNALGDYSLFFAGEVDVSVNHNMIVGELTDTNSWIGTVPTNEITVRNASVEDSTTNQVTDGVPFLLSVIRSGSTVTVNLDGTETVMTINSTDFVLNLIGKYDAGLFYNGKMYELMGYSRAVSAAEGQNVRDYISAKWF